MQLLEAAIFVLYNRLPLKEKLFTVDLISLTSMYFRKGSKAALTASQVNVIQQFFPELSGMDFSICSTKCIPTFLYALLNQHIVNPKIVHNQTLLIFARLFTSERKLIVLKYCMQWLRHGCAKIWNIFLFIYIFLKIVVSLFFLFWLENPLKALF